MIYPDVQDLTTEDLKILCDAYRKNNFIDPETSEKLGVKRGLRNSDGTGVLAGLTNIPVFRVSHHNFLEVAF